jgi:hypothetical protein
MLVLVSEAGIRKVAVFQGRGDYGSAVLSGGHSLDHFFGDAGIHYRRRRSGSQIKIYRERRSDNAENFGRAHASSHQVTNPLIG